jgi:Cystathionine beta-lyases/cystathionine gamma-synthases
MSKTKSKTKFKETTNNLRAAKLLSPKRKTTSAKSIEELVIEQLDHFAIDPTTEMGAHLQKVTTNLYESHEDLTQLWQQSLSILEDLPRKDRIAFFNAKRFLCFQIAKLLDTLMHPLRKSYQSIVTRTTTHSVKGPYPVFDNLPALFSANPVITRTATYIYACAEWIDDAFQGKELMLDIYSRLLNPTSVSLANHIVDISTGPDAGSYLAWNFNSGMAAIDAILSHLVGYQDIVLCSRNVYGGTYQLLEDWFGKSSNLDINIHWFDGCSKEDFEKGLKESH